MCSAIFRKGREKLKWSRVYYVLLSASKSVRACWTHMFDVPIMLNAHKNQCRTPTEASANLLMLFFSLRLYEWNSAEPKTTDATKERRIPLLRASESSAKYVFLHLVVRTHVCVHVSISTVWLQVAWLTSPSSLPLEFKRLATTHRRRTAFCSFAFFYCLVTSATKRVDCVAEACAKEKNVSSVVTINEWEENENEQRKKQP